MNIFVLDRDPHQAAQYHLDKHVVKMPLETAQILATVNHAYGQPALYKPTHAKHPCTAWAMASKANYSWLVALGHALCMEYTHRYGRKHACEDVILSMHTPPAAMPDVGMTQYAQAMPEELRGDDPVLAYRRYYVEKKAHIAVYTRRQLPPWMVVATFGHSHGNGN